ncbi:MAG: hypothetical protein JXK05_14040 [Campylobacterales bacterium]|nr:hypothetical protein [Campylobacterales bacterium]
MVREIIKPTSEHYDLHIPKEYLNQEIEILILPFSYPQQEESSSSILKETAGMLRTKGIDPVVWQRAIRDDYER